MFFKTYNNFFCKHYILYKTARVVLTVNEDDGRSVLVVIGLWGDHAGDAEQRPALLRVETVALYEHLRLLSLRTHSV